MYPKHYSSSVEPVQNAESRILVTTLSKINVFALAGNVTPAVFRATNSNLNDALRGALDRLSRGQNLSLRIMVTPLLENRSSSCVTRWLTALGSSSTISLLLESSTSASSVVELLFILVDIVFAISKSTFQGFLSIS